MRGSKMNIWLKIIVTLLIVAIIGGQLCKLTFLDAGLGDLSTYEQAYKLDSRIDAIWTEDNNNNFEPFIESYISEADAPIIIVGTATGKINQSNFSFGQEISIDKIIKGDGDLLNQKTFVYNTYGFNASREGEGIAYYDLKNIMKPGDQYLLFMSLNHILDNEVYLLENGYFSYINLSGMTSSIISTPLPELRLSQVKDIEFFSTSQSVLDAILIIKKGIVDKYIQ